MHSCVLNMNPFSSFAVGFEYWAILGIWENSKTDPPEKPTAKLLKELKKMTYINLHFQIRKRAKLLLIITFRNRQLWRWDFAHIQLSSYSLQIYTRLPRSRSKNAIFTRALFSRRAADYVQTSSRSLLQIRNLKVSRVRKVSFSGSPSSPWVPPLTKNSTVCSSSRCFQQCFGKSKIPRFRIPMLRTSRALPHFASKISHFCLGSFSAGSTSFSILSSLSVRIRPHLALETQNFRSVDEKMVKNLHSKSEKCNFDQVVLLRKNIIFFHFFQVYATSQRVLTFNLKNEKSSSKMNEKQWKKFEKKQFQ